MGKILLFVSFVVTLLTAGLGFVNKGKLSEARAEAEQSSASLKAKTTELATKENAIKEANAAIATANAEKEQATAAITAAESKAKTADDSLADLTAKVTAAEDKAKTAETDLASVKKELEDLKVASTTPTNSGPSPEQLAMIEELKTVNQTLTQTVDSTRAQLEEARSKETARTQMKMRDGVEGRVLAVNPAWNFVVLNLGDKQGVVNNAELLVKRGRQLVGKVRITSVEPSTSIADIVANSVPSGTVISPGDNVIFQAVEE